MTGAVTFDFSGKVAVVTGGASGMGRAAASHLAAAGAHVVVVDVDEAGAKQVASALPSAVALAADVTVDEDVAAYVSAAVAQFGGIDLFFNNAGILGRPTSLVEATTADYEQTLGVNVKGIFLGLHHVGRQMVAQGRGGAIVNTASIAGMRSSPGVSLYSTSKWAVLGLTRNAAKELGAHGIRVNAICPGPTPTSFGRFGRSDDEVLASLTHFVEQIPLGRLATAEDMARAAMWLFSDGAAFVTGAAIPVDGGQMA